MLKREHDKQFITIRIRQLKGKPCALCVDKYCTEYTENCRKCKWGRTKGRANYSLPEPYYENKFKIHPKYLYDNVIYKDTVELDDENVRLQNELNMVKNELEETYRTIEYFKRYAQAERLKRK